MSSLFSCWSTLILHLSSVWGPRARCSLPFLEWKTCGRTFVLGAWLRDDWPQLFLGDLATFLAEEGMVGHVGILKAMTWLVYF